MTKFVPKRTDIPFRRFELSERRHLNEVARWGIESAIPAVLYYGGKACEEAIRIFHAESPDIVLLDLMLPKKSGFEVLDHIRKFSKIPVLLLTARGQETDKVRGLRGGADDYITKPFGLQELFARIDAVMRRSDATSLTTKTICEDTLIKLDPSTREASAKDQKLKLSPKEFDLLMYLFRNKERVVPRDELLSRVWNYRVDLNLNSRTVDTHVTRLSHRLKLTAETDPVKIEHDLGGMVQPAEWGMLSLRLIEHGRQVCDARRPRCDRCGLAEICPSAGKI
jgi:DNA-binding response OmpR family regulator